MKLLAVACLSVGLLACGASPAEIESACVEKWNLEPPIEETREGSSVNVEGLPPLRGDTDYDSCTVLVMEPGGFCNAYWAPADTADGWQKSGCTTSSGSRTIDSHGLIE